MSDAYHTMEELYDFRLVYIAALFNEDAPLTPQGVVMILAATAVVSFFVTIRNILKNWALWDERA